MNLKKISIQVMIAIFTLSSLIISCTNPNDVLNGTNGLNGKDGNEGKNGDEGKDGDTYKGLAFLYGPNVSAADLKAAFEATSGNIYRAGLTIGSNVYLTSSVLTVEGEVPAGRTLEVISNKAEVESGKTLTIKGTVIIRDGAVLNVGAGSFTFDSASISGPGTIALTISQLQIPPTGVTISSGTTKALGGAVSAGDISTYWTAGISDNLTVANVTGLAATYVLDGKTLTLVGPGNSITAGFNPVGSLVVQEGAIVTISDNIAIETTNGGSIIVKGTLKAASGADNLTLGDIDVSKATLDFSDVTDDFTLTAPPALNVGAIIGNATDDVIIATATEELQVGSISGFAADKGIHGDGLVSFATTDANKITLGSANDEFVVSKLDGNTFTLASGGFFLSDTLTIDGGATLTIQDMVFIPRTQTLTNDGTINLKDGAILLFSVQELNDGAKLTGSGELKAGFTTIKGTWEAVITASATDETLVAILGGTTSSILVQDNTVSLTAKAAGSTITQAGSAGSKLTIGGTADDDSYSGTINFANVGSLVLEAGATVALIDDDATLYFGNGAGTTEVSDTDLANKFGTSVGSAVKGFKDATNHLTQIIGASTENTISGPTSGTALTISAATTF